MDAEETATPLAERKMMRRGLLAGLAALGAAAAMKVTGTEKAQAANGDALRVGELTNTATLSTRLRLTPEEDNPAFQAINGGTALGGRIGLAGVTDANGAAGVVGVNYPSGGYGVRGLTEHGTAMSAFAGGFGVAIRAAQGNNGIAIRGISNAVNETSNGTGSGTGVEGRAGSGFGVNGRSSSGTGVHGESTTGGGVRGRSLTFVGTVGESVSSHGLYGYTFGQSAYGVVAENLGGGPGLLVNGNAQIYGALQVFGAKNAVIKMPDGTNAAVYCQESPEPYFEDFGRAQLTGGVANVALEREFATLVAGGDYMVFLTPEGASGGLYVSRRGPTGFEVRDPGNGNISFTYRIVTKRKDIEGRRFARVSDEAAKSVAASRAALGVTGPAVGNLPGLNPSTPPPSVPQPNTPQPGSNPPIDGPRQPGPSQPPQRLDGNPAP